MESTESNCSGSLYLQRVLEVVREQYAKLVKDNDANDIVYLYEERVPAFVERSLKEMQTRRINKELVEACIEDLYQQCHDAYVYNREQNAFYEIQEAPVSLRLISSDQILIALREHIPASLEHCRSHILKMVRVRLQSHNVFEWAPPSVVIQRMTKEVRRNFQSAEETLFFMRVIGAMVHHKEDVLYVDSHKTNLVHLWFGERVEDVVECVQRLLYNATKTLSPFWNKIKRRMHRSYPYSSICFIHFPSITHKNPFRILKHAPILFLATCSHLYCQDTDFMTNAVNIRRTQHISTAQQLFSHYLHENVVLTNDFSSASKQKFVLLREIVNDFTDYLTQQSLPLDILTKHELMQSLKALVHHEAYGTRGTKHLYYATFRISTGETVHELFLRFCHTMLKPSNTSEPTSSAVTVLQLHNNYRMWCKHYVAANEIPDADLCPQGGNTNRHWYCSYKLFAVLVNKRFGTPEKGCQVTVCPVADIWKLYLEKHANDQVKDNLECWVAQEFGITASTLYQTTQCSLNSDDLTEVAQQLDAYVDASAL